MYIHISFNFVASIYKNKIKGVTNRWILKELKIYIQSLNKILSKKC